MKKFYVEVKIDDVEDLTDIVVDDFEGDLTIMRLKDPNLTLYFARRDNYEEHHLKYELYKILQNLW